MISPKVSCRLGKEKILCEVCTPLNNLAISGQYQRGNPGTKKRKSRRMMAASFKISKSQRRRRFGRLRKKGGSFGGGIISETLNLSFAGAVESLSRQSTIAGDGFRLETFFLRSLLAASY